MSLLGAAVGIGLSWAKAGGAGEWNEDVGALSGETAIGGLLEELERETGKEYPYIADLRHQAARRWYDYLGAWPWGKASTLEAYNNAVIAFFEAIQAEESKGFGGLGGITEIVKKPFFLIIIAIVVVVVIILLAVKR